MKIDPDTYEAIVLRLRYQTDYDRIAREVALPSQGITAAHVQRIAITAHSRISAGTGNYKYVKPRAPLSDGEHNLELQMQDMVRNQSRGLAMAIRASKQRGAGQ